MFRFALSLFLAVSRVRRLVLLGVRSKWIPALVHLFFRKGCGHVGSGVLYIKKPDPQTPSIYGTDSRTYSRSNLGMTTTTSGANNHAYFAFTLRMTQP